jgi:cell wall-associated NlpC family hydrolase
MIEQSHRSLLPSTTKELDVLQQRANRRRSHHKQTPRSITTRWQRLHTPLDSFTRSLTKVPTRFLLHTIIALTLPVAVGLSQLQTGTTIPTVQTPAPQSTAFVVPVAPLSLDIPATTGDAPLEETDEIPIPLSLTSRTEALAPVVVDGIIAGERILLRNGPGTEYDAVGRMSGGTVVQLIGRYGDWYQVRERVDRPVYWVSGELLNMPESAPYTLFELQPEAIPAAPPPKVGVVRESGLQLRDGPGTNYVPMTKLDSGNQLELIEVYQDWFHVGVPGGADGWEKSEFIDAEVSVLNRLLVAETIPDPNPALVGVVNDNLVNLRKGPDSKYPKVSSLDAGVQLDLIGKHNDWFQVKLPDGAKAWIFSDLINTTERVVRRVPVTNDFPALPTRQRAPATRSSGSAAASSAPVNIPASGDVASYAVQFAGSRYVYGGSSPRGFDCSGFTMYVYNQYGVRLPHSAAGQYSSRYGALFTGQSELSPGDLVFFSGTTGRRGITHVALYIGGGRIIHAMTPRYGVQVSDLGERYWQNHYYGALRPSR